MLPISSKSTHEEKRCLYHNYKKQRKPQNLTMASTAEISHERGVFLERLSRSPELRPSCPQFWHGRAYNGTAQSPPTKVWSSAKKPRDDHGHTPSWLTASEYQDEPEVARAKIKQLASLIRLSNNTVIYSGAGISRAAGIGQAAPGAGKSRDLSTTAKPTATHYAVAQLAKNGFIQGGWVQQNHDGLPQKAGFPQEDINEIHGSWYDPANPVVVYSGDLHKDNFKWMRKQAREADLVLVMGTTLGGLNADQVAHKAAERSCAITTQSSRRAGKSRRVSLGMVIINLQQTIHDGMATLRIFGETDHVFQTLLQEMQIEAPPPTMVATPKPSQDES
jgi:NAD-dependent SIR2 family protein deacetylase